MKLSSLALGSLIFWPLLALAQYPLPVPFPPIAPRGPDVEHRLPTDQPQQVSPRVARPRVEPGQLNNQARELAKLAESIPSDVDKVGKGLLPKDLNARLKRIEKLSKQLRREISP